MKDGFTNVCAAGVNALNAVVNINVFFIVLHLLFSNRLKRCLNFIESLYIESVYFITTF